MATAAASSAYTALVVGSTGAVGRDLVAELVASTKCAKVIALARREIPQDKWAASFPSMDAAAAQGKLEVRAIDFERLSETDITKDDKIDAAFCCLGTTRKDAGSAEAFRKVDLHYTTRFGELCKQADAPYFGLLTSTNANKNSWFLYPQTKGEAEANIKALGFARTSFFRPGLLNREELARTVEKIGLYIVPSITTRAVAKGMVADYETSASDKEWSNADLKKFDECDAGQVDIATSEPRDSFGREAIEDESTQPQPHASPAAPTQLLDTLELTNALPVTGVVSIATKQQTEGTCRTIDTAQLETKYALYGFALHHFLLAPRSRSRFSALLLRRAKPFDLETRLCWERELHTSPLTSKLTGQQVQIGLQAFRNISGFMGNRASGKGQVDHCFKLLRNVMPRAAAIKDEIFCQLCKQLTGNPDATAARNGWLLVSACLVTFPPSATLAPFLERFFADHVGYADDKAAQFAAACLASLHEWTTKGKSERKEIPSVVEIESLRDHTTVGVRVWFIDGSAFSFGVTSWTTCAELTETVAQRVGVVKKQAFSLFEISPVGEERRADPSERVVDLLALWERLGVEKQPKTNNKKAKKPGHGGGVEQVVSTHPSPPTYHHLLYKVFLHVPLDDDMVEDLTLVYKQAVHDITRGVVASPLHECIQLAAYQLYVVHGSYSPKKNPDVHRELPSCLPSHLVSATNRLEIAGRVQQAYEALSTTEELDQISAQQTRLAYLKVCGTLRLFGSTFFAVHNTRDRAMPPDLVLAVNHKGIAIVSVANEAVLQYFPYVSIATWGYSSNAFVFVVATHGTETEDVEYVFKTKTGKAMNDIVAAYVAFILACSTPKTS